MFTGFTLLNTVIKILQEKQFPANLVEKLIKISDFTQLNKSNNSYLNMTKTTLKLLEKDETGNCTLRKIMKT